MPLTFLFEILFSIDFPGLKSYKDGPFKFNNTLLDKKVSHQEELFRRSSTGACQTLFIDIQTSILFIDKTIYSYTQFYNKLWGSASYALCVPTLKH